MLLLQALFAKLQQLATVAGDVFNGEDKPQKILLARLTETVVMWLSDEQEFWGVFEDDSIPIQPVGLQQVLVSIQTVLVSNQIYTLKIEIKCSLQLEFHPKAS